jgi:hypothetical protein
MVVLADVALGGGLEVGLLLEAQAGDDAVDAGLGIGAPEDGVGDLPMMQVMSR